MSLFSAKGLNVKIASITFLLVIVFGLSACQMARGNSYPSITAVTNVETPSNSTLELFHFFTRADKDVYPLQPWQLTPITAETETIFYATDEADPASLFNAHLSVSEVNKGVGFHVLEPTWLPDAISFDAANYDPKYRIAYLFYALSGSGLSGWSGLRLEEGLFPIIDHNCQDDVLCNKIGAGAVIDSVKIGDVIGEYVEGYWHLTDNGPVWEHDSSQKTMRWQVNGMFFELSYLGGPEFISKADMIKIVDSLK